MQAIREKVPTFSFELSTALKYIIRIKNIDIDKRINDLQKAKECLDREIKELEKVNENIKLASYKQKD